jgi:NodT family efflux transporter outer membrane factor (OMF) lipoprotein
MEKRFVGGHMGDIPGISEKRGRQVRHNRTIFTALLSALLPCLAGCTGLGEWYQNGFKVGPNYSTTAANVSDAWIDSNDPHLRSVQGDTTCWWVAFGDPALDRLIAEASEQNLSLKMAGARILEARAEAGVAAGNLFPQQQEATGQYTRSSMSANTYPFNFIKLPAYYYDTWSAGFDAAWELDFWGRFRRAVESADARLDAQVESYDNVLVLLQAEVATNYIQMRSAEERLVLAQKNVDLQKETLRIITLREQQGLVTELDVQQATTNLGTTEALLPVLRNVHRRAQNRLCILTGRPPYRLAQTVPSPGTIPQPPQEVVLGIPAELLRRRPDVRQAEREAAAQSARIGIAEAEFYPHIAITGTIGVQAENASQLFESNSLASSIGPGFHWNILNYGRIKNNVNAEDARFQQAVINYRDVVLRANEEVEDGIIGYLTEQDRLRALDMSTRAAARSVDIALQQYQRGIISYQPLLDSQRALVFQQDASTESRGLVAADLVAIYKALGGGWQARLPALPPAPPANRPEISAPQP